LIVFEATDAESTPHADCLAGTSRGPTGTERCNVYFASGLALPESESFCQLLPAPPDPDLHYCPTDRDVVVGNLDSDNQQLFDDPAGTDEGGANYFSFWADSSSSANYCLTFNDPNCPGVYANEWTPVRTDPPAGDPWAIFYLAEIEAQHQSKTLIVSLWDPGEGMESMEILDPNGAAVDFTFRTSYNLPSRGPAVAEQPAVLCPSGQSNYCLDVQNAQWGRQLVTIEIPLAGLPWGTYPNDWFKVRCKLITGQTSADWTTWGVEIIDDSVRLLE
jgi:hypothetical protein